MLVICMLNDGVLSHFFIISSCFLYPGDADKELHRMYADLLKKESRKQIVSVPSIIKTDDLTICFDKTPLGSGAFGKVYEAQLDGTREPVCVKFIKFDGNSKTKRRDFIIDLIIEASILCFLRQTGCVPNCFGIAKVAHAYAKEYLPYVIFQAGYN